MESAKRIGSVIGLQGLNMPYVDRSHGNSMVSS